MSVQVRTLESALHDEFDPKRRLHGWARSGMAMDGEDFIDLAKVSKRVPGKTPAQVSDSSRGSFPNLGAPFVINILFMAPNQRTFHSIRSLTAMFVRFVCSIVPLPFRK